MKLKAFVDPSVFIVENLVNKWLNEHPDIVIIHIEASEIRLYIFYDDNEVQDIS